ncbi:hypothetical protein NLI96_g11572 [Meripilus lineatus]|uniref:Glucose-methanol-choline oxidoreductase N-terminal domain-containing protein n=1 Tax=Meripilus lineatus TaxID=2056292 RepID=A0AAD5UT37_9APHY|nr:hypothetical protein NLI96_g11572 [Physisporinus lineatus]
MSSTAQPEYDIIFAGGGTSACVAAGRLAAADPSLKILILEAGPSTYEDLAHLQPGRYLSHLAPDTKTVFFNVAKPSAHLGGRSAIVPTGQCLGGGSSINFLMYTRPSLSDYDDWEMKYHNLGWGSKDLLPLIQKTETFQPKKDQPTHGYSGPLKVSSEGVKFNIQEDFLHVFSEYEKNREKTDDGNTLSTNNVFAPWHRWIDGESGRRSDVAYPFVYSLLPKSRMVVQTECLVTRVIIENGRAVGVEYVRNKRTVPDAPQEVAVAIASRLVVVSGGTFGSPTILERSGIGARDRLEKLGVKVAVDLPGVGEGYQDHSLLVLPFLASQESVTLDKIVINDAAEVEKWSAQWEKDGTGLMASTGLVVGSRFRPTEDELKAIGPEFETKWKEFFAPDPDKAVILMGLAALYLGLPIGLTYDKFYTIPFFLPYPTAVGRVHISSGEDAYAPIDFDTGFLQTDDDLALLLWGYKKARELGRRMKCFRGEYLPNHPSFPAGSAAACHEHVEPAPLNAPDIVYTPEDDEAIKTHIRASVSTTWHSLGTCSMKPREEGGVVDPQLNVYGVKGLKVVDMSIAPGNVGANTYSTALTIGEKAALIIASELGISGV